MDDSSSRVGLTAEKRALLAIRKLRARIDELEAARNEPIAIIGMGCRFPGGATDPEAYWQILSQGKDAVCEVPKDRWACDAFYDADRTAPGKGYTKWAGFLHEVADFDPLFFRIFPVEAEQMDPQQRLLLEVSWEAIEHAGQSPERLHGSEVGVFVGFMTGDYQQLQAGDVDLINAFTGTGLEYSFLAGRLSYLLGFQGPTMVLATACSSSLVAVHLACQSLRHGECRMALAGGVNLMLSPEMMVIMSKNQALAPDGRCKTYDASADGYGRGEGCGVVVLKRLSDAIADEDNILAMVRGSAVNHDGPSSALTAPSPAAQQAVIRHALASGKADPLQVSYLETHGTGTPLGDPIELQALNAVYCSGRPSERRLALGSVKTNIGHLEPASGVAGLIKVVLALQHEMIPPHLHLREVNPHISMGDIPVVVPTSLTPWRSIDGPRLGALSSFGLSGTNAHVVVEEAPAREMTTGAAGQPERPRHILALSARSGAALKALAEQYALHLEAHPAEAFGDVCFTANAGRSHFEHRLAVVAAAPQEAQQQLAAFAAGAGPVGGHRKAPQPPPVAFLFAGLGSQLPGVGRQLHQTQPTFRRALDRCAAGLEHELEAPLLEVLHGAGNTRLLETPTYAEPALFALEYALAQLWLSWGVKPQAVMGHGTGEYVAACIASVFSCEDGLRLALARGRLRQGLAASAMAVVDADEATVAEAVSGTADLWVVAIHGPQHVVVTGVPEAVERVVEDLARRGISARRLPARHQIHSPMVQPMLGAFEAVAREVAYKPPQLELVSTVSGREVDQEVCEAGYWSRQLREPVRFSSGLEVLRSSGCEVFVEVGPAPVLAPLGRRGLPGLEVTWAWSLGGGADDWSAILGCLGTLYTAGVEVDWPGFDGDYARHRIVLPTYPFQRRRFWIEGLTPGRRQLVASQDPGPDEAIHPLLGRHLVRSVVHVFEGRLRPDLPAFLEDHRVHGMVVAPAAAHLELAFAAGRAALGAHATGLDAVTFQNALLLSEGEERIVQVILTPQAAGGTTFQIISTTCGEEDQQQTDWVQHTSGNVCVGDAGPDSTVSFDGVRARCKDELSVEEFYRAVHEKGLQYGPHFKGIRKLWRSEGEALGLVRLPDETAPSYHCHPALLDACFQVVFAALPEAERIDSLSPPHIPLGVDMAAMYGRPGKEIWSHASIRPGGPGGETLTVDFRLFDGSGGVVMEVLGLHGKRVPREALMRIASRGLRDWFYGVEWRPKIAAEAGAGGAPQERGAWVVLADEGGVGQALAARLAARGEHCQLVVAGESCDLTGREWRVRPSESQDYRHLLDEVCRHDRPPLRGVVHLWSLDVPTASPDVGVALSCRSILSLVGALADGSVRGTPRLWLATRGGQHVEPAAEEPVALAQWPAWGLGRVIRLELRRFWGGQVDLDPRSRVEDAAANLEQEIWQGDSEDQLAYRRGQRHVMRLVHRRHLGDGAKAIRFRPDGTYLVTGGLGGLGLEVSRWMVEQGARHLLLLELREASGPVLDRVRELEEMGARVVVARCDVCQRDQLSGVLGEAKQSLPPLRGLFHTAGIGDNTVLLDLDWQRFARVLGPKVAGAWNLHTLTLDDPLDFFVLFSSQASLLGSVGQGSYVAANAFLDALAHHRRAQGLTALTINWGPWSEVGIAAAPEASDLTAQWRRVGIGFISTQRGLQALGGVLGVDVAQVGVLRIHWTQLVESFSAIGEQPLLSELVEEEQREQRKVSVEPSEQPELLGRIAGLEPGERREVMLAHVQGLVTSIIGLDPSDAPDAQQPLMELGVDSLLAIEMVKALGRSVGHKLPTTLIFDYPTIAAILDYLDREVLRLEAPSEAPSPESLAKEAELAREVDEIRKLSPDEIRNILAAELDDLPTE